MSDEQTAPVFWVNEEISPWDTYAHGITRVLASMRTPYQEMAIVETGLYGKALVLDGKWQSCTGDEFLYHEPLIHPACLDFTQRHRAPRTALVLGGGEGATVRELLRWSSIERATMVDIDGDVVEACKQHLPEMHRGAFDDPRCEVIIGDAKAALDDTASLPEGGWDIIVSDLSDPIEDGPSFELFTKEFFERMKHALTPGGVLVVQSGSIEPVGTSLHPRVRRTVHEVMGHSISLHTGVPSYPAPWSFVLACEEPLALPMDAQRADGLLLEHLGEEHVASLRAVDGIGLAGMCRAPKHVRQAFEQETEQYTLGAPPAFYGKGVHANA